MVQARMHEGPGSASMKGWKRLAAGAAHLPLGRWRSPMELLKALDELFTMSRKRTDGEARPEAAGQEGLACLESNSGFECLNYSYFRRLLAVRPH